MRIKKDVTSFVFVYVLRGSLTSFGINAEVVARKIQFYVLRHPVDFTSI